MLCVAASLHLHGLAPLQSHHGVDVLSHINLIFKTVILTSSMDKLFVSLIVYFNVFRPVSRSRFRVTSLWVKHLVVSRLRWARSWMCLQQKIVYSICVYFNELNMRGVENKIEKVNSKGVLHHCINLLNIYIARSCTAPQSKPNECSSSLFL